MTSGELYALVYYCLIAFGVALLLVVVQGAFLSLENRFARRTLPVVPLALCLGMAMSSLLSGRNLKFAAADIRTISSIEGAGGGGITRALTAIVLALCFAKLVSVLMRSRLGRAERIGGQALFVTLLLYFLSTHVLSAVFGAHPAFVHNSYYPILVFSAFFMARAEGMERAVDALKLGLLLLMLGSLVAAVAMPALALQTDYPSWIPGFKLRLWGLGSNANSIGPLALLLALLLFYRPYGRRWVNALAMLSLLTVFLLSQSKTVWAAGLVCLLILMLYGRGRDARGGVRPVFVLGLLLLALAVVLGTALLDLERIANKIAATKVGGDLSTLTGRSTIWAEAWHTWLANPWFGYGPEAWGPLHRARIGLPFAFHAHNQLMQSLSGAGLFGGLAMLAYLACMLAASLRAARYTRGVSLALAVVMLARVMTEAPLELEGLFIGETIIHLAWFMIVLVPYSRRTPAVEPRPVARMPAAVPLAS